MEARPYQSGLSFWLTILVLHGLCHRMSDRKALARAIAARTTPRFIEIKKRSGTAGRFVLGPDEMRLVEKERKRLLRLLIED